MRSGVKPLSLQTVFFLITLRFNCFGSADDKQEVTL